MRHGMCQMQSNSRRVKRPLYAASFQQSKDDNLMTAAFKIGDRIPLKAYAGIDVGSTLFDFYIIEPFHILGDPELRSQDHPYKNNPVNRGEIRKFIEICRRFNVTDIVLESTGVYHTPFVEEFTKAGGFDIRVVPANKAKDPSGGDKSDEGDSEFLARLSLYKRVSKKGKHTIKPSYIPQDPVEKALRKIDRMRTKLTSDVTRVKNRIHKILASKALSLGSHSIGNIKAESTRLILRGSTEQCMNYDDLMTYLTVRGDVGKRSLNAIIKNKVSINTYLENMWQYLEDVDRFLIREHLDVFESLTSSITRMEQQIAYLSPKMPEFLAVQYEVALRNKGVDKIAAISLATEFGDLRRFASRQSASSYTGLRPKNESSGGKSKKRGQQKNGSKHLRRILYLIAQNAKKHDDHWKRLFEVFHTERAKTKKQTNCIIARKFAVKYYRQVMEEHEKRRKLKLPV